MGTHSSVLLSKISIIAVIGRICSGKSTIARQLSEQYNVPVASFGGYLFQYSVKNSLPTDRKDLQDLGEKLIREKPIEFLKNVIEFPSTDGVLIILEGIRHRVIFDAMREISDNCLSIFIQASDEIRLRRYLARNKDSDTNKSVQEFDVRNQHLVEREIEELKKHCDLILNSETQMLSGIKIHIDSFMNGLI